MWPLAPTTTEAMWGDRRRVVPLGGVGLGLTENVMFFTYVPPRWLNSRWPQFWLSRIKPDFRAQEDRYSVQQMPHKPSSPTLFSSSSLVLLVSKWARPVLCSMSSWCCCGLWVWPRLYGRAVSSSAPAWMCTPVFYQFISGLDAAQGCWTALLLPACKTAPVNIINS